MGDVEDEIVAALNALGRATISSSPPAASAPPMTTSPPMRWPRPSAWASVITRKPMPLLEARYRQGRIQRHAQAHGAHSRRRQPDQEQRLGGAGISNRQCLCDGRRAHGDAGDDGRNPARACRAARRFCRSRFPPRCRKAPSPRAWRTFRKPILRPPSALIPGIATAHSARSWWCALATRPWRRPPPRISKPWP